MGRGGGEPALLTLWNVSARGATQRVALMESGVLGSPPREGDLGCPGWLLRWAWCGRGSPCLLGCCEVALDLSLAQAGWVFLAWGLWVWGLFSGCEALMRAWLGLRFT